MPTVGTSSRWAGEVGSGRVITIPAPLHRAFGLEAGEELIAEQTPEGILLRPAVSVPVEIYTEERIAEFARDEQDIEKLLPEIE